MSVAAESVLGIDYGSKRIGLALASLHARLPRPLITIDNDGESLATISSIIEKENVTQLVIGYPRNQSGQATLQSSATEEFARQLSQIVKTPIVFKDESLTSKKALAELENRGRNFTKADIDALAATYILEDWIREDFKATT